MVITIGSIMIVVRYVPHLAPQSARFFFYKIMLNIASHKAYKLFIDSYGETYEELSLTTLSTNTTGRNGLWQQERILVPDFLFERPFLNFFMMQKPYSDSTSQSKEHESEIPQGNVTDSVKFGSDNNSNASIDAKHEQERSLEESLEENGIIDQNSEKPLCRYFQRGFCRYNEDCRYSHERSAPVSVPRFGVLTHPKSTTPCRFFSKGYCRYGDDCRFAHGSGRFHYGSGIAPVNEPDMSHGEWSRFPGEDVNMLSQVVRPWDEDTQVLEAHLI
ncbi:14136_t:CDS:2 [Acaulospora morrowiae]|uniref:14136_t:CDS:1 n=1 Tax=Acaulospora morrowiae TaxID=94023 RepID=A0A9N9F0J6_9GLOM|nr:14136_t:CDS:2 [Acaulospora morrowiae]